jgi:hypothetical protein
MRMAMGWIFRMLMVLTPAFAAALGGCSSEPTVEQAVRQAVAALADTGQARQAALDSLQSLPAEQVVPALVDAIDNDPKYSDMYVRTDAFAILRQIDGQDHALGRDLLIRTLPDSAYHMGVLKTLARVDSVYRAEVAEAVWPYAGDGRIDDAFRSRALWLLIGFGYQRPEMYELGYTLLHDSARHELLRQQGARAMLENGDFEEVLESFDKLSPTGLKVSLWALAVYIDVHPEVVTEAQERRDRSKALVVKAFRTPDSELRKGTLDVVGKLFGPDLIVIRGSERVLDPQLAEAMRFAIRSEPDPTAVRRIEAALRTMEKDVARLSQQTAGKS